MYTLSTTLSPHRDSVVPASLAAEYRPRSFSACPSRGGRCIPLYIRIIIQLETATACLCLIIDDLTPYVARSKTRDSEVIVID